MPLLFETLTRSLAGLGAVHPVGRIVGIHGGLLQAENLDRVARIGDRVVMRRPGLPDLGGEVMRIDHGQVNILPDSTPEGMALGERIILKRRLDFAPGDHWMGRVVDPFGRPLDGKPLLPADRRQDPMAAPAAAVERQGLGQRLETGLAVMNTLLPVVDGQRLGLFAGAGIGKSRLLAQLARKMQADVVVVALIGERGREVNEFTANVLGEEGMQRSVVVAATSDQSAATRRRCAWSAMAVAEFFRQSGRNVLFLADSITRFAEAHREIACAAGEVPALRGYPPSVAPLITGLCERAGPGPAGQGSITALFSVLVAGSDMDEPIADILRGVLDGHIVLSRDIAERGRFPAIDVGKSVSRSLPNAATTAEQQIIAETRRLLGVYERSEMMIQAGLYVAGTDPVLDQAVRAWPDLDAFFARAEPAGIKESFDRLELILRRSQKPGDPQGMTGQNKE